MQFIKGLEEPEKEKEEETEAKVEDISSKECSDTFPGSDIDAGTVRLTIFVQQISNFAGIPGTECQMKAGPQ